MLDFEKGHYGELEAIKNFIDKPQTLHRLFAFVVMMLSLTYYLWQIN